MVSRDRFWLASSPSENGFIRLETGFVGTVRLKPVHGFATPFRHGENEIRGREAPRLCISDDRPEPTDAQL